jgi:hypothetical protein
VSAPPPQKSVEIVSRVLRRTGLVFPRGMLGDEVARLAAALHVDGPATDDLDALVTDATTSLWGDLQPPILAAVRMHLGRAEGHDYEDLSRVLVWAEDADPDNPLARALTVRAAQELGAAVEFAEGHLRAVEPAVAEGGRAGAVAAARVTGVAVVALLDLDPEDFATEIVEYIERGEDAEALDALARMTGDLETRSWARDALRAMSVPDAPFVTAAVHHLADGDPPPDPADDAVWVPTILALADEGIERALAQEADSAAG